MREHTGRERAQRGDRIDGSMGEEALVFGRDERGREPASHARKRNGKRMPVVAAEHGTERRAVAIEQDQRSGIAGQIART